MKKCLMALWFLGMSVMLFGQGNGKIKNKRSSNANREHVNKAAHDMIIWSGTGYVLTPEAKDAKNRPSNVDRSLKTHFPDFRADSWAKYKGQWAATNVNPVYTTTVVFAANGDLRDARTVATSSELASISNNVLKAKPGRTIGTGIKITLPDNKVLYRVQLNRNGQAEYAIFDASGIERSYDY